VNSELKNSMFEYYEQRAGEYDELYTLGTAPKATTDPAVYRAEVKILSELVASQLSGALLDAPCGAGYWSQFYGENCSSVTMVDQSRSMLEESREKVRLAGVQPRTRLIQANVLEFEPPSRAFDSALVGYFVGHLTDAEMESYFTALRRAMRPGGKVLILESIWSDARQHRPKQGTQQRSLKDGRVFDIYKRYFLPEDFHAMRGRYGLNLEVQHAGQVYIAASGQFDPEVQR
jgi:demethylmenaquinone methyltransferase/2-methoxy-6-polyprenyl-1,4-benzoquinol methylase